MSDIEMWLNAMACVRPTDEFAEQVGRDVIRHLMAEGREKSEPGDPFRRIVIEVKCS